MDATGDLLPKKNLRAASRTAKEMGALWKCDCDEQVGRIQMCWMREGVADE